MTDAELDAIDITDEDREAADRFVKTGPEGAGQIVWIESTPDMFCVLSRYDGPKAGEMAEEHRQGTANVLAEIFAMRRLGLACPA
jgi:hypothetical protein